MTERKSPTAVLREGPRALSDEQVREIEDSSLAGVLHVDIDDVIGLAPDIEDLLQRVQPVLAGG